MRKKGEKGYLIDAYARKVLERWNRQVDFYSKRNQNEWNKKTLAEKETFIDSIEFQDNIFDSRERQVAAEFNLKQLFSDSDKVAIRVKRRAKSGLKAVVANNGMAGSSAYMLHYGGSAWTFESQKPIRKFVDDNFGAEVEIVFENKG